MELVLITSLVDGRLTERAIAIAARRHVAICHVAAASWSGRGPGTVERALVARLVGAGVAYTRIEQGADLAAALSGRPRPSEDAA